jgi:formate dehydrogenase accessory protein FdhE
MPISGCSYIRIIRYSPYAKLRTWRRGKPAKVMVNQVDLWQTQISRAAELAETVAGARELLAFYARLLAAQSQVYEYFLARYSVLSGELAEDLSTLRPAFATILNAVENAGPEPLVAQARTLKSVRTDEIDRMLIDYWDEPSDTDFFAKAFLQPYGQYLSSLASPLTNQPSELRCPFCGAKPQLSFLQNRETGAESGNRDLMCAKCLSVWPFRRAVCAHCGEEQPSKLCYFQATTHNHVRVEACDTCKHYLKGVDLTRVGHAQPLVDEVAAAPLDLWATEHGYTKIELNLVGL